MSEEKKENLEENNKEEIKVVNELETMKKELEETTDRFKRLMAEFENYKKRNNKEREMLYNSLLADIVLSFLPIMDNLEKSLLVATEDKSFKQGIELVVKQFSDAFNSLGVETIKTVGETFDPEIHEAVSSVQDETKGEKEIVEEFRKGYKIGSKVIRHAMVVVAN